MRFLYEKYQYLYYSHFGEIPLFEVGCSVRDAVHSVRDKITFSCRKSF